MPGAALQTGYGLGGMTQLNAFYNSLSGYSARTIARYGGGPMINPQFLRKFVGPITPGLYRRKGPAPYTYNQGTFRFTVYLDNVKRNVSQAVAEACEVTGLEMEDYARQIAPHDTGAYAAAILAYVETTSTLQVKIVLTIRPGAPLADHPLRFPQAYAMFVEFGGRHTPAYGVFRRTADYGIGRFYANLDAALAASAA